MRLRLLALLVSVAVGLLAAPLPAESQQAGKVYRIGYLGTTHVARNWEALQEGLRDLGYVQGKNILIERRYAGGNPERLPDLAAELVGLKVDAIVAAATAAVRAAKPTTNTTPIVMVAVVDPVGAGLVASLARPGGNITGLSLFVGPEIVGKQLELLKEAVPNISRVAVLWNSTHPGHPHQLREAEGAAHTHRFSDGSFGELGAMRISDTDHE